MTNLLEKSAWTPTATKPDWEKPLFARCVLNYNNAFHADGRPNMNTKAYKPYFSLDWDNKTDKYDEMEGMRKLITNMILDRPPEATRWACLYINLTLDLSTSSKNYNYKIAYFKGHTNIMPKFKPSWMRTQDGGLKIHITNTLLAAQELEAQSNVLKMLRQVR